MTAKRISQKDFFTSVSLVLLSTICLAISAGFWKYLTTIGSVGLVIFIRFFFPFLLVALWTLIKRLKVRISSIWPHILRALVVLGGQYSLLYVLANSNLLLGTLLYSTSGLFAPPLLYLFFRVRASNKAILAIIISFIGVAIALGTWENIIAPISLIGLLSGLLTAAGQIIQHRTTKSDNIVIINLILFGLCSLFSLALLFFQKDAWLTNLIFFDQFSFKIIGIILTFSVLSIANQTLKNTAFKYVKKATTLAPFMYATIIFSGLIDWFWLGIVPQVHTIIGTCIIILGGMIMSVRKVV